MILSEILAIYQGSDGEATKALFEKLKPLAPIGEVAINLFRAHKASARAKVYRGGGYKGAAYDKKNWAMKNLTDILRDHGEACAIRWGWKADPAQDFHNWVLYVDLPTGQVSFHAASRGTGPDYPRDWDGVREAGAGRICRWIADLLAPVSVLFSGVREHCGEYDVIHSIHVPGAEGQATLKEFIDETRAAIRDLFK